MPPPTQLLPPHPRLLHHIAHPQSEPSPPGDRSRCSATWILVVLKALDDATMHPCASYRCCSLHCCTCSMPSLVSFGRPGVWQHRVHSRVHFGVFHLLMHSVRNWTSSLLYQTSSKHIARRSLSLSVSYSLHSKTVSCQHSTSPIGIETWGTVLRASLSSSAAISI